MVLDSIDASDLFNFISLCTKVLLAPLVWMHMTEEDYFLQVCLRCPLSALCTCSQTNDLKSISPFLTCLMALDKCLSVLDIFPWLMGVLHLDDTTDFKDQVIHYL